jgi:quinol monooxygenase YgiN
MASVGAFVRVKIKPEHKAEFEEFMKMHVAACKKREPGMLQFEIANDVKDSTVYYFYEKYADHAAHEEHAKAPTLSILREKFPIWSEERELRVGDLWPEIT